MKPSTLLGLAALVAGLVACGSDSVTPPPGDVPATNRGTGTSPDTSGSGSGANPTSHGPIVTFSLTPHQVTVPMGSYASLAAIARDAAGARVVKQITWRSSNSAVAIAVDSGVVYGKALGTTTIYASVDGFQDSASVTVGPAATQQPPVAPPASKFSLRVVAMGAIVGTDTSLAERVAGATVTVVRVGGISGDTLATPETLGTGTTDANGEAKFSQLPGGFYTIRIAPPAGSGFVATQTSIFPPRSDDISISVTMRRP